MTTGLLTQRTDIESLYISGPMSGYENFNFSAFAEAKEVLLHEAFYVFSPHDQGWGDGDPATGTVSEEQYEQFLRVDFQEVAQADAVVVLPGWEKSRGAKREVQVARWCGIPIFLYETCEEIPSWLVDAVLTGDHYTVNEGKPTNPKDAVGSDKLPFHLWPQTATALGALGLLEGMLKYGRANWRETGVRASIYYDALQRHLGAWFEGEDCAPDSGVHHLGHALACIAILVDADAAGQLNDDRQYPGGYHQLIEILTPKVKEMKERHSDKSPKHWTIVDG